MDDYLRDAGTGAVNLIGKDMDAVGRYMSDSKSSIGEVGESLQDFAKRIVEMGSKDANTNGLAYSIGTELPIMATTMMLSSLMPDTQLEKLRAYSIAGNMAKEGIKNLPYGVISGLAKAYANDDAENASKYTVADAITSMGAGMLNKAGINPTTMAAVANMAGLDDYIRKMGDD